MSVKCNSNYSITPKSPYIYISIFLSFLPLPSPNPVFYAIRNCFCLRKSNLFTKEGGFFLPKLHGVLLKVHGVLSKVHGVSPKVHGVSPQVHGVLSKVHGLSPKLHGVLTKVHGVLTKVHGVLTQMIHFWRKTNWHFERKGRLLRSFLDVFVASFPSLLFPVYHQK